jgi:hypothetical protein
MLKTIDENGVDCWIMDREEYADAQTAYSDSITAIKNDKTMIIKLVFPEDQA